MRKKLAALIGTLCILSGMISVSSAAEFTDIADNKNSVAINTVCGLGIMEETENGMFSPEGYVTRGDAAVAVGKLMNYAWNFDEETSFADVPSGAEEAIYINTLKAMGIMRGYSDNYFGYEDVVTLEQFETILLRATGYMALDAFLGRSEMLAQADFLDGVTALASDKLTRADMAQLLYNCLETQEISIDYDGGCFPGKTVLENRHKLRKFKGVMTANSITRLSSNGGVGKGNVEIDSVSYETTYAQADELLGYPVVAYCEIDSDIIKYMYANPSGYTVIEMPDYDIMDIDTDGANVTVKYEYNSKMKSETFGITDNIMYNGTAISELTDEMLDINMGSIKVIELNGGVRNVFIESYEDYIVEYVNTDAKTIFYKEEGKTLSVPIPFDLEDCIKFYKFGYETTFDQIKAGEVLSVYDNKDNASRNITVYISDDTETGKITGYDEEFVYINGKTYRPAEGVDFKEYVGSFEGPFYIDASGRIIGADKENNTGLQYGCLVKILYDETLARAESKEKDFLKFKILGENGQITDYTASNKLRINERKVFEEYEKFPFEWFKKDKKYYNQLIKFQVDYEGKVTSIYTENQTLEESPVAESDYSSYRYRSKSGAMFSSYRDTMIDADYPGFFVDASTIIFSVPSEYTGDASDYKVTSVSSFREMGTYQLKPYDKNEYSVAKVLMATSGSEVSAEKAIIGVNSVLSVVNSDDDLVQGIKCVADKKVVQYEFHHNVSTQVKKGDIIQINVDENGKVNAVNVIANAKSISELIPVDDFHYDFAIGEIDGISGDYLRLKYENGKMQSTKLTNATQYYIYRKDTEMFEVADKNSMEFGKNALVQILTGYAANIFMIEE